MNIYSTFLMSVLLSSLLSTTLAMDSVQNLRVVWSTAPATQALIAWDSPTETSSATVVYDTKSQSPKQRVYAFEAPIYESGLYHEISAKKPKDAAPDWISPAGPEIFYHQVPLKNLKPDTMYYLAVKNPDGISQEYRFKTAPSDNKPFKLIYGGDSRTQIDVAQQISVQMAQLIEEDDTIIAMIHGGDFANKPRRDLWKDWLEAYNLTTTSDGKLLPIIPIIGNHEFPQKSPLFRQAYGYPGGDLDYYTCHLTPEVSILCLNTEISTEGDQRIFVQAELEKLKKSNIKWQLAAFHKPAFPAIKQPSGAKVSWVPLFDEYNLDLVLESDGHCIKRTVPIRNGTEDPNGTVYLGEGGYGAPQRQPKPDRWYLRGEHAFASKGDHVMLLEFTPKQINYSTLLMSGETVDSAVFKARR